MSTFFIFLQVPKEPVVIHNEALLTTAPLFRELRIDRHKKTQEWLLWCMGFLRIIETNGRVIRQLFSELREKVKIKNTSDSHKVSIPDVYYPYFGQLTEGPFGIGDVHLLRPIREGIYLNTLGLYFGASFILGMVVRYFPSVWISLSRQQKGDRINPLVRRFVTLIQNRFPQIALEFLDSPDKIENLDGRERGLVGEGGNRVKAKKSSDSVGFTMENLSCRDAQN